MRLEPAREGEARAADERAAGGDEGARRVVQGQAAVDGVAGGQRRGGGGPEREYAQRRFVMRVARGGACGPAATKIIARSRARPGSGRYHAGRSTASGSIASMSITSGGRDARLAGSPRHLADAAEHEHGDAGGGAGAGGGVGIDDERRGLAEAERAGEGVVGVSGDRRTETAPSRLSAAVIVEVARARPHHHADLLAGADARRDQAADDGVDAPVGVGVGEGAAAEEEERALRMRRAWSASARPSEISESSWRLRRRARRGSCQRALSR